jgi:threonyl-tRNA synthetase
MQNAAQEASVEDDELHRIRHSLAHVLAQAVLELRPGATLGFGPPIADGFYYDFVLPEPLSDADLVTLEKKMKHIIKQGQKFECQELPPEEAYRLINDTMHDPYKLEYSKELLQKHWSKKITF